MIRILLLSLLGCPLLAGAQCGFDGLHQRRMVQDTAYAAAIRNAIARRIAEQAGYPNQKMIVSGKDTSYMIPLVLHVIHNGEAIGTVNNPSDAQLKALVSYTNAAFEASWPAYPSPATGGVRTKINFVLAKSDPQCNSTNGIVRINASAVPGYTQYGLHYPGGSGLGAEDSVIKKLSSWNLDEFMNIYIVNRIDSNFYGYATLPYSPITLRTSGLFIIAGAAMAGSTTLVHELGHYLGLYHTFEEDANGTACPPLTPCNNSGDYICDTEPGKRNPSCTNPINPCTGRSYNGVQYNFMNYTPCPDRFTAGQRDWMLMYLKSLAYWGVLTYSRAGDTLIPQPAMVPAACKPTPLSPAYLPLSVSGPVLVVYNDIYRRSRHTRDEGLGSYVDNTCRYRTTVTAGIAYPISVGITPNFFTFAVQDVRVYIDLNNDGQFQVPAELLFSGRTAPTALTVTGSISIPKTGVVLNKPLRMRIVCDSAGLPTGPCGALKYGQAEDYAVTVVPPAITAFSGNVPVPVAALRPNPAHDLLLLSFDLSFEGTVRMYNILGQDVYQQALKQVTGHSIRTAGFPAGVYTLMLRDITGSLSMQKVYIQH